MRFTEHLSGKKEGEEKKKNPTTTSRSRGGENTLMPNKGPSLDVTCVVIGGVQA